MSECGKLNLDDSNCFAVDIGRDYLLDLTYSFGGVPIDLTAYSISMSIRENGSETDFLTLGIVGDLNSTGIYIAAPSTGIFKIVITKADTALADNISYNYEIVLTDPSSKESTFLYGVFAFKKRLP